MNMGGVHRTGTFHRFENFHSRRLGELEEELPVHLAAAAQEGHEYPTRAERQGFLGVGDKIVRDEVKRGFELVRCRLGEADEMLAGDAPLEALPGVENRVDEVGLPGQSLGDDPHGDELLAPVAGLGIEADDLAKVLHRLGLLDALGHWVKVVIHELEKVEIVVLEPLEGYCCVFLARQVLVPEMVPHRYRRPVGLLTPQHRVDPFNFGHCPLLRTSTLNERKQNRWRS